VKRGADWNITNALGNLKQLAADPWAGYWKSSQSLAAAIDALG
jgi:hypothetical protein